MNNQETNSVSNHVFYDALQPYIVDFKSKQYAEQGLYYGYPICCIIDFIRREYELTHEQQHFADTGNGFIPCPDCSIKLLRNELTIESLLSNRLCKQPFPKDDC
ncbi:hypothetical protein [Flavobacterium filum]|uniref:hypothetical protein n=1 Tax=Flavobacterium filum TaxID=370974 RepID=UPI0023F2F628|nr:hypothetical protein [Flavobacterium filum]